MNTLNCFAGGIGIMVAGFLKSSYGLGAVFAGISIIMLVGAVLTGTGWAKFLARDLERRKAATADVAAVIA